VVVVPVGVRTGRGYATESDSVDPADVGLLIVVRPPGKHPALRGLAALGRAIRVRASRTAPDLDVDSSRASIPFATNCARSDAKSSASEACTLG
jgi:hypothetical protein